MLDFKSPWAGRMGLIAFLLGTVVLQLLLPTQIAGASPRSHLQSAAGLGTSSNGPSATTCTYSDGTGTHHNEWIAYHGLGNNNINIEAYGSQQPYIFSDTTPDTPAVACAYSSFIFVAWKVNDSSNHILVGYFNVNAPQYYCSSSSSCHLKYVSNPVPNPSGSWESTPHAPSLASDGSKLWLAWTGANNSINIAENANPFGQSSWTNKHTLGDQTIDSVALAYSSYENRLYVAWPGIDQGHHLNLGPYNESGSITHQLTVSDQYRSDVRPGLTVVSDGSGGGIEAMDWRWVGATQLSLAYYGQSGFQQDRIDSYTVNDKPALTSDGATIFYAQLDTSGAVQEARIRSGYAAIVLVHGFSPNERSVISCYGSGSADGMGDIYNYLSANSGHPIYGQTRHWGTGNINAVQYYSYDTGNCDTNLNTSTYEQHCSGYYPFGQASNNGTPNASLYHISCLFAWYLYETYASKNIPVEIVAHSMGGLIVRNTLYQVAQKKAPQTFPSTLGNITDVVTVSSPHEGITGTQANAGNLPWFGCNGCLQVKELEQGSYFMNEMQTSAAQNPQMNDGTDWTLLSGGSNGTTQAGPQNCDTIVWLPQAVYMQGGHKVAFDTPCYGHESIITTATSSNDNTDASVHMCSGCGLPTGPYLSGWTSVSNQPRSLHWIMYALLYPTW